MNAFIMDHPEIAYRLVGKNSLAFAFLSNIPIVPGHTLIVPHRIIQTSEEMKEEEWFSIIELKKYICGLLHRTFGCGSFNFAWNEGAIAGQSVPHFHLHIVPRKENDAGIWRYEPREFLYRPGSRARCPKEELKIIAQLMRQASL